MEPCTFILFGATGDLAKRKIYPALYNLFVRGMLPRNFSVVGLGRREWTADVYQAAVERSLYQFSRRKPDDAEQLNRFLQFFAYRVLDIGREEDYRSLLALVEARERTLALPQNRLYYLSVGPEYFETIADRIRSSGLGAADGWKRLVIEKPFGRDLHSARALNRRLAESFAEEEIFRIDHYLGKPVVQRLESLQQANPIIQALWTNRYIANVQITASETVGVEERAGYYDHVGALRDMFQNHLLQLLMMTAIRLPYDSSSEKVRFQKKQVMEALEPVHQENVGVHLVRAQYAEGSVGGQPVVGYASEPGIPPASANETFVAARLRIDNGDWRGIPFYIRTGKRMKKKSTRIVVEFREPLKQARPEDEYGALPNLLVIEIGPEESISLRLNTKEPGTPETFKPIRIDLHLTPPTSPEAYENLIGDALRGDAAFFAHWDEVELSWQWVQPVLDAFANDRVPLRSYAAGTYGPAESDALLAEDGYRWWFDDDEPPSSQSESTEGDHYARHAHP
ncbi:glucose-6-phosphate dehydrogenase [Cohnella nanjingensis]|uniref:Glucose-6-phosphate 1-dehydrogenase n=1 Tax=Cohnella nanjingensis TaxID=1387779 RepID=A0A7X0RTN5_9BACL|nr:glucose-6-phosphate dehydrogenase [Cohnella nanjingensis]MBB6673502.1 glucose-6-phosphate dehydrogenase [Cohnella nanjingensis]